MIKIVGLAIIAFTFMIGSTTYAYNEKLSSDEHVPFEKIYFEYGGYKSVEDALGDRPPAFNVLSFEKDGWQYILSIDKRVEGKVTVDVLVEIANSIR
ncbi:hypothetical protein [Bacillus sp. FJAT-28004]|uniref:hypothetical protein n=1 Tax=Bacillus sp. FJAT-28004 TaxID=1679165 RepID=UPI0006B52B92|nr:hypothetical protein [Bacillus sp. FJAT-28004]